MTPNGTPGFCHYQPRRTRTMKRDFFCLFILLLAPLLMSRAQDTKPYLLRSCVKNRGADVKMVFPLSKSTNSTTNAVCNGPNFLLGSLYALWSPKHPHEIHIGKTHAFRRHLFAPPVSPATPHALLSVSSPGVPSAKQPIHLIRIAACSHLSHDPRFGED